MSSGNEQDEHANDLPPPLNGDYIHAQNLYSLTEKLRAYEIALMDLNARDEQYRDTLDIIRTHSLPFSDGHNLIIDFFPPGYDPGSKSLIIDIIQDIGKIQADDRDNQNDPYQEWQQTDLLKEGMRADIIGQSVALYLDTHYRNPSANLINFSESTMFRADAGLTAYPYQPYIVMMTVLRLVILREYALSKITKDSSKKILQ